MSKDAIRKNLDELYESLTPEDVGRHVSIESWEISRDRCEGRDASARVENLYEFMDWHKETLPVGEYIRFLEAFYRQEVKIMTQRYFHTLLRSLEREYWLLGLILRKIEISIFDVVDWESKVGKEKVKALEQQFKDFKDKQEAIVKEIEEIWNCDIWDFMKIPRPKFDILN